MFQYKSHYYYFCMLALDIVLSLYLQQKNLFKANLLYRVSMQNRKSYPYLLVSLQMLSLLYIATTASVISNNTGGLLVECAGIFLAIRAIYVMKINNMNITPTIKENSEMVVSGPYKVIRHPMYLAQIIAVIPLIIDYYTIYRLGAIIILAVTLLIKINYEEKQLVKHFPKYKDYTKKTFKLLPFIY
jgi:protein-S-isoprenylcysteine O-methyltransferase Ste14